MASINPQHLGGIRAVNKTRTFAQLVKFEHTVFALPFAYLGALLASGRFPGWTESGWITVAMVGARSAAMGLNRVIDRTIDAKNPRTAGRPLSKGLLTVGETIFFILVSIALLFYAVWVLSPRHMVYLPLIVGILVVYSYTKRFTYLCHLVLGIALGFAPLGGWVAVTKQVDPVSLLLMVVVALWVAGFDIIYATQDLDFDRQNNLHSIPVRFGLPKALLIARLMHVVVVVLLVLLYFLLDVGWFYLAGTAITAILLHYEHSIISPSDLSRVGVAFFNINGIISVQLFLCVLIDVLL